MFVACRCPLLANDVFFPDRMRNTHDKSKPLFMFLTPHAPHAPYTPAPRHKGLLAGLKQ